MVTAVRRRSQLTAERLPCHPSEVLELIRWSMPAPLVDSALELDPAAVQAALRFLAWCRLHEPGDWRSDPTAPPFLTVAFLLLHVASPPPDGDAALTGWPARWSRPDPYYSSSIHTTSATSCGGH